MKKQLRKAISFVLAMTVVLTCFTVSSFAKDNTVSVASPDENTVKLDVKYDFSGGKINRTLYDEDGNVVTRTVSHKNTFGKTAAAPSSYDLRNEGRVTSVKDQGDGGTCWAFGATCSVESNYITKGYGTASGTDFSEDHLVWFSNKKSPDLNDGITKLYSNTSDYGPYYMGGNWQMSTTTLVNYWGAELERNAPYNSVNMNSNGNYDESRRTSSYAHLQSSKCIAYSNEDTVRRRNEIKNTIMTNGAVDASYYHDDYNIKNNSYYYESIETGFTNHEVSIVGWNDSVSKSNFRSSSGRTPSGNGAWLIKNSYGTDSFSNGYMWLSYYDKSISEVVSYEVEQTSNYDHVRSYNGYSCLGTSNVTHETSVEYANAFKTQGAETLKSVGIWTVQEDVNYTIKVYRNLSQSASDPTSGTLVSSCTTSGNAPYMGYYTVKLNNAVNLSANERYAIVVRITENSPSDDYHCIYYPFEGCVREEVEDNYYDYNFEYDSNAGESFLKRGGRFVDTHDITDMTLNNAFINAYTSDSSSTATYTLTYNANGGSVSPSSVTVQAGDSVILPVPSKSYTIYYNANGGSNAPSSQNVALSCKGWATNSSATSASYSCGSNYKVTSNTTLYAVWNSSADTNLSSGKPSRSGYTFLGWSEDSSATSADFEPGEPVTVYGSSTLYAIWKNSNDSYKNGLIKENGVWYYYSDGRIDRSFEGMAKNQYGWWYVKDGTIDFTYTGMAKNQYGWWYIRDGKLDTTYTGMAKNQYGWWYFSNGKLDTTYTGMAKNQYGWWYFRNGKIDYSYRGLAKNQYGWWYIKNGTIDFTYNGTARNQYGIWRVVNGKVVGRA